MFWIVLKIWIQKIRPEELLQPGGYLKLIERDLAELLENSYNLEVTWN
jgi:hypothetical protein